MNSTREGISPGSITLPVAISLLALGCGGGTAADTLLLDLREVEPAVEIDRAVDSGDERRWVELDEGVPLLSAEGHPLRLPKGMAGRFTDSVAVLWSSRDPALRSFRLPSGEEILPAYTLPEGMKLGAFVPIDGARVLVWDRQSETLWTLDRATDSVARVSAPVQGNPGSVIELASDTVWLRSTLKGGSGTPTRERAAWGFSLAGEPLARVLLPEEVRHDQDFIPTSVRGPEQSPTRGERVDWSPRFGLITADNRDYRFRIIRGDTAWTIRLPWEPVGFLPLERAWWEASANGFTRLGPEVYTIPETKPAFRSATWDSEGRIWVHRHVPAELVPGVEASELLAMIEPQTFDVFSAQGEYLWSLRLPLLSKLLHVSGDRIMVAERHLDEKGWETVSIFRVGQGDLPSREPEERLVARGVPASVRVIGDTTVLTTKRPASLDTARLVQVARIGLFDGPEEFLLIGVDAFTVGAYGEVYVAEEGIRVFSPDGSQVRRISRTGAGPGEVGPVTAMEVDERGRLLAVDLNNRRVAVIDTSGTVLDHWRLPYGRPGYGRNGIVPIPGMQTLLHLNPPFDTNGGPLRFPRPIYQRVDSSGAVLDTLFAPARLTEGCPTLDDPHFAVGFWQDIRASLYPKVKWTASRSGELVVGCPAEYVIDRIQPDGTVLRIVHEREPMIEPARVRKRFVESYEERPPYGNRDWRWVGPAPPEQKPYYHLMIVGRDGRLWVWPAHLRVPYRQGSPPVITSWQEPTTGTFDVFERDGRFLGQVLLPEGAEYHWYAGYRAPFFAGDTAWLVRRDSLGVSYVDKMVVEWPTNAGGAG